MILERVTNEQAATIGQGDYVVSPYSAQPFMPLRVSEVQSSPTGRVMLLIHSIAGVSQMTGGWSPATAFWFPPAGYKWNRAMLQWEQRTGVGTEGEKTEKWPRPTLADLGITRGEEGFLP